MTRHDAVSGRAAYEERAACRKKRERAHVERLLLAEARRHGDVATREVLADGLEARVHRNRLRLGARRDRRSRWLRWRSLSLSLMVNPPTLLLSVPFAIL